MNIFEMTGAAAELRELLRNDVIDEQTFNDNLEAIGAPEKVEVYCSLIKQIEVDITTEIDPKIVAYEAEIARLKALRQQRINNQNLMKERLKDFLIACGGEKQRGKTFTAWLAESKSLNIENEKAIPEEFMKITKSVDKSALKKALESGEIVEGAKLETSLGVRIR